MRYVAAHKPAVLKAKLTKGRIQKIKFEITDAAGKTVAESEEIQLAEGKAQWEWTPNTGEVKVLPDEEDLIKVGCRIFWFNPDGSGSGGYEYLDDLTVFRDDLKIKVLTEADAAVIDANVRIVVERPGALTRSQKLAAEPANAEGEVTFTGIEQWNSIGVVVGGAWVLQDASAPWKAGKDKGLNREVTVVPKKYKAAFKGIAREGSSDFVVIGELGDTRVQYVNFDKDQKVPRLSGDETAAHYGHLVQIRVGPEDTPREFANDRVYVKFEAGTTNSKRNKPKPLLTGQGKQPDAQGILELKLDSRGLADCDLELGYAGGDTFTLKVCSVKDFSGTVDQTLKIQNWRQLFYELMAPETMTPSLVNVDLPGSAHAGPHYDLPDDLRDWLKKVLDPVFVSYKLSRSYIFKDDKVHKSQIVPALFLGRGVERKLYIASFDTRKPSSVSFSNPLEAHTVGVLLFDLYFDTFVREIPGHVILKSLSTEVAPSDAGRYFLTDFKAVRDTTPGSVPKALAGSIKWDAVISAKYAKPPYTHPGLDEKGVPRTGMLPASCFKAMTHNVVKIVLPDDSPAASLAGEESGTKCPIKVSYKLSEVGLKGGGYEIKTQQQVMNFYPKLDTMAFLFGHELGHAMNMTIMEESQVPPGMDVPKHVDNGGTYYRHKVATKVETVGKNGIREPGQGEHCATGLADMAATTYPKDMPASGCIMFGYAPSLSSQARTAPILFCTVCTEYVKAQKLTMLGERKDSDGY